MNDHSNHPERAVLGQPPDDKHNDRSNAYTSLRREFDEFTFIVAHDLAAPIRGINNLASWLSNDHREALGPEGVRKLDVLMEQTKRLHRMHSGIIQYSLAGNRNSATTAVDTDMLVRRIIDRLSVPDTATITIARRLPECAGDRQQLELLFTHLLRNAIAAIDKNRGTIIIDCSDGVRYHRFSISDNGVGIDPRYHDKIFSLFWRIPESPEGDGLGLALARRIVQSQGGDIRVESRPGHGSVFYFSLPNTNAAPATALGTAPTIEE